MSETTPQEFVQAATDWCRERPHTQLSLGLPEEVADDVMTLIARSKEIELLERQSGECEGRVNLLIRKKYHGFG